MGGDLAELALQPLAAVVVGVLFVVVALGSPDETRLLVVAGLVALVAGQGLAVLGNLVGSPDVLHDTFALFEELAETGRGSPVAW